MTDKPIVFPGHFRQGDKSDKTDIWYELEKYWQQFFNYNYKSNEKNFSFYAALGREGGKVEKRIKYSNKRWPKHIKYLVKKNLYSLHSLSLL